ncbi:EF-hand domain-containing protein [Frigoriglobus tundricola]|uniref:EF-hand domain-containing protein n=1 Tax=Frigoriglobus tundricola TaxID=2774151 RepID=A0A6M5YWY3_9BACT|nr:hypothetical protein [Frigoriglobus tundricola]QJW97723.1 hypothetical protein FTUN_5301 [Frigoriglobus tundricola]
MRRSVLALAGSVMVAGLALAITTPTARPRAAKAQSAPVVFEAAASSTLPTPDERTAFDPSLSGAVDLPPSDERSSRPVNAAAHAVTSSATRTPSTRAAPAGKTKAGGSVTDFLAGSLFRQLDTNGDGVLTGAELPTAYRAAAGARGGIDRQTFAALFQATVQTLRAAQTAAPTSAGSARSGEVPQWFAALDPEGTGQVSVHSWRTAGRGAAEFQQMDANSDGLLTRSEVLTFTAQSSANGQSSGGAGAGAGTRSGSTSATQAGSDPAPTGGTKPASRADALLAHYGAIAARSLAPKSRSGAKPAAPAGGGSGSGAAAVAPAATTGALRPPLRRRPRRPSRRTRPPAPNWPRCRFRSSITTTG